MQEKSSSPDEIQITLLAQHSFDRKIYNVVLNKLFPAWSVRSYSTPQEILHELAQDNSGVNKQSTVFILNIEPEPTQYKPLFDLIRSNDAYRNSPLIVFSNPLQGNTIDLFLTMGATSVFRETSDFVGFEMIVRLFGKEWLRTMSLGSSLES